MKMIALLLLALLCSNTYSTAQAFTATSSWKTLRRTRIITKVQRIQRWDIINNNKPIRTAGELYDKQNHGNMNDENKYLVEVPRRSFLFHATMACGGTMMVSSDSLAADSAADVGGVEGLVSPSKIAEILLVVPTFTLVDAQGVPYMVVGEDAKVTGYFFTTFEEANRILQLAIKSADKAMKEAIKNKEDPATFQNPWKEARISTVPLSFAVTLVKKSMTSSRKNYFKIAAAESDIDEALKLTGKSDLAEGKVPVFYMSEFRIRDDSSNNNDNDNNNMVFPVYFQKSQLIQAFQKNNPKNTKMPDIQVSELFAILQEIASPPKPNLSAKDKDDLEHLVLIAPKGSLEKEQKCRKKSKDAPPFVLGERNLIL